MLPCKYKVGANVLDVFLNGQKLIKATGGNDSTGHYYEMEIPNLNGVSNCISLTSDWGLDADSIAEGRIFEFVVRGEYK